VAKIKVLLIEDNRLLREGISKMLENQGDFAVESRSEDGETLKEFKDRGKAPDVVLLDLGLEKADSLELTNWLRETLPETRVIAMDILPEQVDLMEFVKAGGSGFILKSASLDEYVETIKSVAAGKNVLPPVLTTSLFTQIVESALEQGETIDDQSFRLTQREKEVVDLISEGLSNKEIASRLHIATHTVKSHIHNILEKLALSTRLQIAAFAQKKRPQ
jgi:DNA-binding NarL/FixJ family response regulator